MIISNNFTVKLTYIIGGTVIAASNIFLDWWGALFGTEIIILSFSILYTFILNNKSRLVKKVFQKDAIIFFFIGLAILSLGIMFGFLFPIENIVLIRDGTNNKLLILTKICKYSYYILFSVYSVLSVCTHINYSYIIGRIGLANINH